MTTGMANQVATLQRIAVFSAAVRGHEVGGWQIEENSATATCLHCGAAVRVYFPALDPKMDGPAVEDTCGAEAVVGRAA